MRIGSLQLKWIYLLFAAFLFCLSSGHSIANPKRDAVSQAADKIDRLINQQLQKESLEALPVADDGTFLRRAYLDIIGRIPSYQEILTFTKDTHPNKRNQLVSTLLNSDGYVHHYFHFWADLLRYKTRINNNIPGTDRYGEWIKQSIANNKPYDVFVQELLLADGHAFETPTAGYYTRDQGMPLDHMANTVQVFLGTRIQCAMCHNHPFDKWTQQDFYGMAAYTYGIKTRGMADEYNIVKQLNKVIKQRDDIEPQEKRQLRRAVNNILQPLRSGAFETSRPLKLPKDYQYQDASPLDIVEPKPMFGVAPDTGKHRSDFAHWVTDPANEQFAKVIANRLWKKVFGEGLIEPVDDMSEKSQASHPELMVFLEQLIKDLHFDLKQFLLILHHTDLYQREAFTRSAGDTSTAFQGPLLRRLSAEQLWDSIMTLMITNVDHVKPPPTGEIKNAMERTYDIEVRANALKDLDVYELQEMMDRHNQYASEFYEQRSALIKKRDTMEKSEAKGINKEIKALKIAYEKQLHEIFGTTEMSMTIETSKGSSTKAKKRKLKKKKKVRKNFVRASELPSPMYQGHFLREFGQSDRNVIDNADDAASIPQALALMNHWFYYPLYNDSALRELINKAPTLEEKLERLFTSIRSRKPNEKEKQLLAEASKGKPGPKALQSVLWSLLNSKTFLFIQ